MEIEKRVKRIIETKTPEEAAKHIAKIFKERERQTERYEFSLLSEKNKQSNN